MIHIILIPLVAAVFLAVNMGGSGIAAAFSSSYGANLIRKDLIPGLFGAFVLLGAVFSGMEVTLTIGNDIINETYLNIQVTTILLLSIGLSMLLANILKVPQSTSQSTVFAILGIGAYLNDINTKKLFLEIIPTWFYLPVFSFLITFIVGKFIYKPIRDQGFIDFGTIKDHPVIKYAVILGSCYVAYAIGANNVANASGPILSLFANIMNIDNDGNSILLIVMATLLIAPWFGIGGSIFSSRVLESTGKEIISFGPLGALVISVITGSLLIYASVNGGIPAALAQLNIGSIIGLGVYKVGFKNMFTKKTVKRIFVVWIIAPIIAFIIAYLLMYVNEFLF
ncbi:inorganic phosphate transporter [Petroclostridium sp. X23]|uniref:inorganic phosphate transporter n=1 Tax=Petroclostridium sp. X23 TaxID=3045146 RepID=UPI0024ADDCD4|nr:inorganic phosphate transporter [Petroclostridium sp. X23]WHH57498.1 inorganic phosphate transporter [Petroclostridium sp. X23]